MPHYCHAIGCRIEVPPRMFACLTHYNMLSPILKKKINQAYRPGQEIDKVVTIEYMTIQRECVQDIAIKEGIIAPPPKILQAVMDLDV